VTKSCSLEELSSNEFQNYAATRCNTLQHTLQNYQNRAFRRSCPQRTPHLLCFCHPDRRLSQQHLVLQWVAARCSVVKCGAEWCSMVQCGAVCYHSKLHPHLSAVIQGSIMQYTVTHYSTLQHTATHCNTPYRNTLKHTETHRNVRCNTLSHAATQCSKFQYAARHCKKLQDTATHCNTLGSGTHHPHCWGPKTPPLPGTCV